MIFNPKNSVSEKIMKELYFPLESKSFDLAPVFDRYAFLQCTAHAVKERHDPVSFYIFDAVTDLKNEL